MFFFKTLIALRQLGMVKPSQIGTYGLLCFEIERNFRIHKPVEQSESDFINEWYTTFMSGAYDKYLIARQRRRVFYLSKEWKDLCKKVHKQYGYTCMACGSKSDTSIDHIKSRYNHPELELDFNNLQVLCKSCNINKSNKEIDYRDKIR